MRSLLRVCGSVSRSQHAAPIRPRLRASHSKAKEKASQRGEGNGEAAIRLLAPAIDFRCRCSFRLFSQSRVIVVFRFDFLRGGIFADEDDTDVTPSLCCVLYTSSVLYTL